ncbi:hypothetical protein ACW9HC_33610, partial [Nocardia gipuzkoensis]
MSPRPGGDADKIGNSYEAAWIVARMLDVLQGWAEWIKIEPLGDLRDGAEFIIRRIDGVDEAHQVKRQYGSSNAWNSGAFDQLRIWNGALQHASSQRDFHFVSTVPFRKLQELTDRTRNSDDLVSFLTEGLPQPLDELFMELANRYGTPANAYEVLLRLHVRLVDDKELRHNNAALAGLLLEGAEGLPARASLAELIRESIGRTVTAADLVALLGNYGLRRRLVASLSSLTERVQTETSAWSRRVEQQMLQPMISRIEAQSIRAIPRQPAAVSFLVGPAGAGKTAVLHEAVTLLTVDGVVTLVISFDRYGLLGSTRELGRHLGFDTSPVTALAAANRSAVLIIDQLDAVSMVSGRLTENFDVVVDLIVEASVFPDLRVIVGCRQFDVDNDHRIRTLRSRYDASTISVGSLTDGQVDAAVAAMGLSTKALTAHQRDILRLPLHLSLLATVAAEPDSLNFTNSQSLFDTYWDYKRRAVRSRTIAEADVDAATGELARAISGRQQLTVPMATLEIDRTTADLLISEQLLVRDGTRIRFFHEAIFDYAFARQWVRREDTLLAFLTAGEQELFRRGQVRQIMTHLRATDPERFVAEVRAMLTSTEVRFHIKDTTVTVLGGISDPSSAESDLVLDITADVPELSSRLWSRLRTRFWFDRFDADGQLLEWLDGSEELRQRAVTVMAGAGPEREERVADLLIGHRVHRDYPDWVRHLTRHLTFQTSHKSIDILIDCVRAGRFDDHPDELWYRMRDVAATRPDWVVEVIGAYFHRSRGLHISESGKIPLLTGRYTFFAQVASGVAGAAPRTFCETLLPYLLQVMAVTGHSQRGERPVFDPHFSYRFPESEDHDDVDRVLLAAMGSSIRALAADDPAALHPFMEQLVKDRHEAAQWLLYQGFLGNPGEFADGTATVMLQGSWRFRCGYLSNGVWVAREVLRAICPLLTSERHENLEACIRDLRFEWDNRGPGWYTFNLLTGLCEERLTEPGRRRLLELRRRFEVDQPPEPEGTIAVWVKAPIPAERARHMSNDNWLQAMTVHAGEGEKAGQSGGAHEQAQILEQLTQDEPNRFAQLALRLSSNIAANYSNAILRGLGATSSACESATVFEVVRHIASLNNPDNDRFFQFALHPYVTVVPLDVIELLRDRMVEAADPIDDGSRVWRQDESGTRRVDILISGINTSRGSLARTLATLLESDVDGARTRLVVPVLNRMADDPSVAVRAAVANLIGAAMRHAPVAGREAFARLISTDDRLIATQPVLRLLTYLGNDEPAIVIPVIERMLTSTHSAVREKGGRLATYAALEWQTFEPLAVAEALGPEVREGIAYIAAHRLSTTSETDTAITLFKRAFHDPSPEVRKSAAGFAAALRGEPLRPFAAVISEFIASPAFSEGTDQLLITLEDAPDKTDDLVLLSVVRFITVAGAHDLTPLVRSGVCESLNVQVLGGKARR